MTSGAPQRLSPAQLKELEAAHRLLQQGRAGEACAMVQRVTGDAPLSGEAWQLLAMCRADVGDATGAEAAFLQALEQAPDHPGVLFNFGTWLCRQRRPQDAAARFREATLAQTGFVGAWIKLGMMMLELQEFAQAARAFQRAVELQPDAAQAWQGLGRARQSLGDLEAAVAALQHATRLSPADSSPWVDLGATLQLLGRLEDAVASFEQALRHGERNPAVADTINGLLANLGRTDEAIDQGRRLVLAHPQYVPGQLKLAHLLWAKAGKPDSGEDPFSIIRTAARQQPDNRALQMEFVGLLIEARKGEEALDFVRARRRTSQDDPFLVWMEAMACDLLGLHEQATSRYALAYPTLGARNPDFLNAYARHSYSSRDWDAVARYANEAIMLDSTNQESWAHLGTAWRLAGDPREYWLMDYERLVGVVEVEAMPPFSSLGESLDALKTVLDGMHPGGPDPLNQSVRNGTQTPGQLFARPDPTIAKARVALQAAAERWLATLPVDPTHPFLSRNIHRVRMLGSWSVRLRSSGYHANHFHQDGWMSSAFYVSLPPSVSAESARTDGCIQIGQPAAELGLDLSPRRVIHPKAGHLALFPSYMWHGTVPFSDDVPRLTVAFDMQPDTSLARGTTLENR